MIYNLKLSTSDSFLTRKVLSDILGYDHWMQSHLATYSVQHSSDRFK